MAQEISYHYGSYTHESGSVVDMRWEEMPNHTRRGWRDTVLKRCTLFVQLQACSQGELATKINALSEAYSVNEYPFWIDYADGSTTRHVLDPTDANSIRGPRVSAFELPTAQMEQLVVLRDFVITIEMLYEACENQIIEYQETIINLPGRSVWRSQRIVNGSPRSYVVWNNSNTRIIQEGHSVGFRGWYDAGAYPNPAIADPAYEHEEARRLSVVSPLHYGYSWLYYALEWHFEFEIPAGSPIIVPDTNQPLYTNSFYVPRGTVTPIAPWPGTWPWPP